ncbi:MAG: HYR domain-containing protein [Acidobacteriota bacterium]
MTLSPTMRGMFTRGGSATADTESISTFASSDCATPKTTWNLGETACAVATGTQFPNQRRFQWVTPDGTVAQQSPISSDPASDTYAIPTTGQFAQVGTWTVRTINNRGVGFANAKFVVKDPANASVDLSLAKYGPFQVSAGNNINYRVEVTNNGPDDAQGVTVTDTVPGSTTFVSEAQNSGPGFTCTAPDAGFTGMISCTIASLPAGSMAVFTFAVNVNGGTPDGTTITNTASVSSDTNELNTANNTSTAETTVTAVSSVCTLNCGSNVTHDNDPNQCSAVVTYATPTTSGACGSPPDNEVSCNPPSGSTFPIGATTVSCSTQSGGACSFTVTIHDTSPPVQPTISCPSNVSVGEDTPDSGSAVVNYPAPTTTGNCVMTVCDPASGSSFSVGTTTVSCAATDSANNLVSCSFSVTVTSGATCTLTCPGDVTQTASECSGAVINYAAPTTSGSCGTVSCSPASGSTFPVGTTLVTCSVSGGPSCDFTVTVNASAAPTITTCTSNKNISVNSVCEAAIPNMVGEVVTTGCGITVSQSPAAGSIISPGLYTVTITAENSAGEATCTATVTVSDTTPPVISTCPAPTSASADGNCQAPVPNVIGGVVASDNCTDAVLLTVTQSPAAGTLVGKGTTTITVTVKDEANNSTTCTATFTVNDTTPPTITCPASITVEPTCPSGAVVTYTAPVGTDNCPGPVTTRTAGLASGSTFPIGTTTNTFTVTDTSGNTATCSFTVRVKTAAEVIQDLITRVQALQPPLSGQQIQGLGSKLQAALNALNDGKTNVACNKLADFISQVTGLINNGTLTPAQGQPLIDSAANVRNTLGCTNLGCS